MEGEQRHVARLQWGLKHPFTKVFCARPQEVCFSFQKSDHARTPAQREVRQNFRFENFTMFLTKTPYIFLRIYGQNHGDGL